MISLSDEQLELLDVTRDFVEAEVVPRAAQGERTAAFPHEIFAELARMGLMGLPFAEEHGGSAQPFGVYLRVVEELARGWLAVGLGVSVHCLAAWAVQTYARDELKAAVLPKLTAGEWLGAYSLSEPGSGSDAAALSTRARREGDAYVVDGTKAWVTHGGIAGCYVLMCRTGATSARGISALLVPGDTPGLEAAAPERKMGMAASPTAQLRLDGARVPADHLLAEEGDGFKIALSALEGGRLGISACATGLARAALDEAVAYAREREQFGRPIGQFQGVAFMLADMATRVEAARALWQAAAARRDAGEPYGPHAAMSKLAASDAAMEVTTDAVQVFGGYGYTSEYPVERFMREAKVLQIVEGTNQIQRLVISRHLLG